MKINIGKSGQTTPNDLDYLYENYYPSKRSSFRGYKLFFRDNKWVVQLLASGLILLVVMGVFKTDIPYSEPLRNGVRHLMTDETNVRPVLYKIMQLASQAGNLDWPVIEDTAQPSKTAISEISQDGLFLLPVSGSVVSIFGWNVGREDQLQEFHQGIDIAVPAGTNVKASTDGEVSSINDAGDAGRNILVRTNDGAMVRYGNLSDVLVEEQQYVKAGEVIAKSGIEGEKQPHLHFEVIINGRPVDPLSKLGIDISTGGRVEPN